MGTFMPPMVALTFASDVRWVIPVPKRLRYTRVFSLSSMGVAAQLAALHEKTGRSTPADPTRVLIAVAAATPVPVPLALNRVGATVSTVPGVLTEVTPLPVTAKVARPGAVPGGTMKLI